MHAGRASASEPDRDGVPGRSPRGIMSAVPNHIEPDDIEQKFRELQTDVVGTVGAEVRTYAIAAGAVLAVAVIGVAFLMGRRRGKKRSTIVEVRRI
jgi:hypothetical protein